VRGDEIWFNLVVLVNLGICGSVPNGKGCCVWLDW
jgi:hypothetical protein